MISSSWHLIYCHHKCAFHWCNFQVRAVLVFRDSTFLATKRKSRAEKISSLREDGRCFSSSSQFNVRSLQATIITPQIIMRVETTLSLTVLLLQLTPAFPSLVRALWPDSDFPISWWFDAILHPFLLQLRSIGKMDLTIKGEWTPRFLVFLL